MQLTEDKVIDIYGKKCLHCGGNMLLPYEYEWTCISCGYNVIKRKHEIFKLRRK